MPFGPSVWKSNKYTKFLFKKFQVIAKYLAKSFRGLHFWHTLYTVVLCKCVKAVEFVDIDTNQRLVVRCYLISCYQVQSLSVSAYLDTGFCSLVDLKWIYTVSGKKRPPKHVKITLWIENDSHYFSWKAIYLQCLCEISRQLACPLLRYCFL